MHSWVIGNRVMELCHYDITPSLATDAYRACLTGLISASIPTNVTLPSAHAPTMLAL